MLRRSCRRTKGECWNPLDRSFEEILQLLANCSSPSPSVLFSRESEAAADIGKIVSLMAVDAQRVGMQVAGLYMSYSAPLDLIVATFFLIQLLGE